MAATSIRRFATHASPRAFPGAAAGFTLVELMVVVGIIAVAGAISVLVMPSAVKVAKADGAVTAMNAALRTAREQAISQRRNMRVTFTNPNQIDVLREATSGTGTTAVSTTFLPEGARFQLYGGVPDTPDAFGNATAVRFGTATTYRFTSEGSFVDQNGDALNGTVFIGRSNEALSARAITIFGPTALIRQWRWDGRQWTH
jgi:prepilin-type N-terminal cleavage/methylation domain-containing protein